MDERRLAEFLTSQHGQPVEVRRIRRSTSGPSRDLYLADTSVGSLLLRAAVDGPGAMPMADELALVQSLSEAGVAVAKARWSDPHGEVFGQPLFVEDRLAAALVHDDPGSDVALSIVRMLAQLHDIKPDEHLSSGDITQVTATQIERWRSVGRSAGGSRVPLLDLAEIWLHKKIPLIKRPSIVHGQPDPRRNLISTDGVVALSDWQYAHVGDAAEDWTFLATRSGVLATSRDWRSLIERETGLRFSADEWSYWEAFNLFKSACINRTSLVQFESGSNRAPGTLIAGTAIYHSCLRRLMNIVELQ